MQSRQNALFQTGSVQPIVDFSVLSAVLVITNFEAIDINTLLPCGSIMLIYLPYGLSFILALMLQHIVLSRYTILSGIPNLVILLIIQLCLPH